VQVDPRLTPGRPCLVAALKLKYEEPLSNFAFHFNLRPYNLPFDHTSILREYQTQVPLEFDFTVGRCRLTQVDPGCPRLVLALEAKKCEPVSNFAFDFNVRPYSTREKAMLNSIGSAVTAKVSDVVVPKAIEGLCTSKVLTMTFVEGESLGDIIQRGIEAGGVSSAAGRALLHSFPDLSAGSEPVYPYTLAASSSLAWPLVFVLLACSVPVCPYTLASSSSPTVQLSGSVEVYQAGRHTAPVSGTPCRGVIENKHSNG